MASADKSQKKAKTKTTPVSLPMVPNTAPNPGTEATEHFVRGVITRGEAISGSEGPLPPGVTHEIVSEEKGEIPVIRRRRFSAF